MISTGLKLIALCFLAHRCFERSVVREQVFISIFAGRLTRTRLKNARATCGGRPATAVSVAMARGEVRSWDDRPGRRFAPEPPHPRGGQDRPHLRPDPGPFRPDGAPLGPAHSRCKAARTQGDPGSPPPRIYRIWTNLPTASIVCPHHGK